MGPGDIGLGAMDLTDLVQARYQWMALVNTVIKLRVPQIFGKFLRSCTTGIFTRRVDLH
jgi:hypothetical protein